MADSSRRSAARGGLAGSRLLPREHQSGTAGVALGCGLEWRCLSAELMLKDGTEQAGLVRGGEVSALELVEAARRRAMMITSPNPPAS